MAADFLQLLKDKRVVLLDGAMGTQLDKRGLMSRGSCNLDASDAVLEIHRAYAECGCDALTTNTLTMNRLYIETHKVGVPVRDVNRAGVALARQAAEGSRCVLGDMSSTGQLMEPYGTFKEPDLRGAFAARSGRCNRRGTCGTKRMSYHLVILKKRYLDWILSGGKTIELRLSRGRSALLDRVQAGDGLLDKVGI